MHLTPELTSEVASLSHDAGHRVTADFTVTTTFGPGVGDAGSKSYILEAARPASVTPELS